MVTQPTMKCRSALVINTSQLVQDGTTALFLACQNGYSEIVSMLLEEWAVTRGR